METEIIEEINSLVKNTFQESLDSGLKPEAALDEALSSLSNSLTELGVNQLNIDSIKSSCLDAFQSAINNGSNEIEALSLIINNLKNTMESLENEPNKDVSENYNFNFLDPSNSPNAELINEGLAQGMTVEEAVKNANLKIFPNENPQGPPTLAELKEIKNESKVAENTEPSKENQELNIIEADMDAIEANMDAEESNNLTEKDSNITEDQQFIDAGSDDLEELNKEDEIS